MEGFTLSASDSSPPSYAYPLLSVNAGCTLHSSTLTSLSFLFVL